MRAGARRRAAAERGKLRRIDHRAGLVGRADMGRDDAERAAVEHARDVFRGVGRHPHERGDAGGECGDADLARRLERDARVLDVDIERVEARGRGDLRDLDLAHEAHRHRRHHLVPLELLLDAVAQYVADPDRHRVLPLFAPLRSVILRAPLCSAPIGAAASAAPPCAGFCNELCDRLQDHPRRGVGGGVAGPPRSRGLLPPGRRLRHDRPHLQPHHRAHSRHRRPPADQSLRPALQGDHRLEPGEDRSRGQHHLEARHRLRHQQIRLRDPRRDPPGAPRGQLRAPHPHAAPAWRSPR